MARKKHEQYVRETIMVVGPGPEEESPRLVTPDDPLIINTSPVSFNQVFIEGGDIICNVQADVTIAELKKVS